ncbi:hypothetical protein BH18ACI5_BH18ACI5_19750 [soil metagenome]
MLCKHCGTEIADKAIVCYRCGVGTTEPVRQPAARRRKPNPLFSFVTVVFLLLVALFMGQSSRTAANPQGMQTIAAVLVGVAILLLVLRIVRRR